jgi:VCBS repeat-containing protein
VGLPTVVRFGGLAVALGIGLAAGCPGVAWAVPEDGSSVTGSSATGSSATGAPASDSPDSAGRPSPEAAARGSRASRPATAPASSARSSSKRGSDSPVAPAAAGIPTGPRKTSQNAVPHQTPPAAPVIPGATVAASGPQVSPVAVAAPPDAVVEHVDAPDAVVEHVDAPDAVVEHAGVPVTIAVAAAAAQRAAPAMRATPIIGRVLTSVIDSLGTRPAVPLESPAAWAVLAATRRQLGTVGTFAAPAATVSTGQLVAAPAPAAAVAPAPAPAAAVVNKPPAISKVVVGAPNASTGAVSGTVTAADPNGDALTFTATTSAKGTVTITAAGVFTYTPTGAARHAAARIGATTSATTDAVTVVVTDTKGATARKTVTVRVSPKNAVPVTTRTLGSPNATTGVITGTVSATDADADALTYSAPATTAKGTVSINAGTGAFTYTPNAAARNTAAGAYATAADKADTVTVTVTDGYGGSVAVPVALTVSPKSYVSFTFNYGTGAQYWTPESRAALELAATKVASYLVASGPMTVVYDVTANSAPTSTNLAWATSDLTKTSSGFYATVVQNKIQTGVDANGSAADGVVNVNLGKNWGYGSSVDQFRYDFTATLMHEFVHTLGFITYAGKPGTNTGTIWTKFDSFLVTSSKVKVISKSRWNTAFNGNLTGKGGGLYFGGPNAVAAYGGPVPLYTPSTWAAGSSVNHLNDTVFAGTKKQLMNAIVATGQGLRALSPVEIGVLKDLGYVVVPVPGGIALVFVGVMFLRRRRVD